MPDLGGGEGPETVLLRLLCKVMGGRALFPPALFFDKDRENMFPQKSVADKFGRAAEKRKKAQRQTGKTAQRNPKARSKRIKRNNRSRKREVSG